MEMQGDIRSAATKEVERSVYSLDNPYLSHEQKFEVELWFQFAGDCMKLTFTALAVATVFFPIRWPHLVAWPLAVNLGVGLANWYSYRKKALFLIYLTLFHKWAQWLVTVGACGLLLYSERYLLVILLFLWEVGLLSVVETHMGLYSVLAWKYHMHPKYAFFKRFYGHVFPFEKSNE
jgi:hypothetical protein